MSRIKEGAFGGRGVGKRRDPVLEVIATRICLHITTECEELDSSPEAQ